MKYFLDTEFIERPYTIDLISIGIVAEDGREYYAVNSQCNWLMASEWVKDNVLTKLPKYGSLEYKARGQIKQEILDFVGKDKPEFWGYYADYDWVVFCWLFGTMMELPKGWPMYCNDIKQLQNMINGPFMPFTGRDEHNALEDARQHRDYYFHLMKYFKK